MIRLPDGLTDRHSRIGGEKLLVAGVLPTVALGAIVLAALLGVFAGMRNTTRSVEAPDAELSINAPEKIRNGEFFEMRLRIAAKGDIAQPSLTVSSDYWRELTINTMLPAAKKESYGAGGFRFEFPAMRRGDFLFIKIDGQTNPNLFGGTHGWIALDDGNRRIASLPVEVEVLP